ncbi:unnamed protein product [Bemisia tabaci]|uniref:Uncharacterized protein n=1 Tax=Bemisia tabaci TaxID=7038 RepID=A0A9P0F9A9_BEMTA|nr:unnamed protein product [Bemisia tabaci]
MRSLRAQIALLLIGYGFLCVFVDRGEAQGGPGGQNYGQNQGQQQGGPQNMGTSANGTFGNRNQFREPPNFWYNKTAAILETDKEIQCRDVERSNTPGDENAK